MKLKILLAFLWCFLIILYSCKKDFKESFTVKGRLVNGCDENRPVNNMPLVMEIVSKDGLCFANLKIGAVTNARGEFTFKYEEVAADCFDNEEKLKLKITDNTGQTIVFDIPLNKNIDLEFFSVTDGYKYELLINSAKSYTDKDTLFYDIRVNNGHDSTFQFITGPFLNTSVIIHYSKAFGFNKSHTKHLLSTYGVFKTGGQKFMCFSDQPLPFFPPPPCTGSTRTLTMNLP